ncbi:YaiO family outer membrane beta-barrel protein [Spongiimicrobium salis]|uniref:YaiO family outer membrane beta-barrel protein n=1 Tax=Spongiimicrobium salis TaxID=1667022 RepID=UPI00374CD716
MKPFKNTYYLGLLCLFVGAMGFSQEVAYNGNPDKSFFAARDLAFNGNRGVARDTLKQILTKYPAYTDVRNLLAKTYSWDGAYDKARRQFNIITSAEKENKEVWEGAVKNEIYAKNYAIALGLANKSLKYLKDDADLMKLRQQALDHIYAMQGESTDEVDTKKPDSLESKPFKNSVRINNAFEVFDILFDPFISSSIEYKRETKAGSIIPRVNYSNRFATNGLQYEVDLYPKISKTFYGYVNYGFSDASIFPKHRAGAELYANLPKAMEASLGIRYIDFRNSDATIFTGSVGLYKGNYYFSLRPYFSPRPDGTANFSGNFLMRRYLKNADHYWGLNAGYGISPELQQFRVDGTLLAETLLYVESQQINIEYQFTGKDRANVYRANLGLTRQELVFDPGRFFWAISAGISYQSRF